MEVLEIIIARHRDPIEGIKQKKSRSSNANRTLMGETTRNATVRPHFIKREKA